MTAHLIDPHGGELVQLLVEPERCKEISIASRDWSSWTLSSRQLCDLELLCCGGLSPLRGFMSRSNYEQVCNQMHLLDGTLWPLPITLDLDAACAKSLKPGMHLALRDPEGVMLAALTVEDLWQPDRRAEAECVFGTTDPKHPGVRDLLERSNPWIVSGPLEGLQLPVHHDYRLIRLTPRELRQQFIKRGWQRIMAFHTTSPMHRVHHAVASDAALEHQTSLLVHPAVGRSQPGDLTHFTRVRCWQEVLSFFPRHTAMLALLPLWTRMAGPREALLHGIIRQNHGCTHLMLGPDHASPPDRSGAPAFYEPRAAQELFARHQKELGIQMVPRSQLVYVQELSDFLPRDQVPETATFLDLPEGEFVDRLDSGRPVPAWFSFPRVIRELTRAHPPRHQQGLTIFFTGLPSAGKSTLANVLLVRLLEMGGRPVTLLDGDIVRRHLSSELTFSRAHRDLNILRIGFVASEITKNGGIAICAPIAPFDSVRREVSQMIRKVGSFVLVHVATLLEVCEQRDRKGMYAKARAGLVKAFTGITDPYEPPEDAEVVINTADLSPAQCTQQILLYLEKAGYLDHKDHDAVI